MKFERIKQVGVIGSAADLQYSKKAENQAELLGELIAQRGYTLIFGAEKDCMSLSTVAALAARKLGGLTVGITYDKGLQVFEPEACSLVVATGLIRGGGRETVQSLSCDGIVALAGGSGTLNEICVAYQANVPVVCLRGLGGWSDRLAGEYLDARERYKFMMAEGAAQALECLEANWLERSTQQ